MSSLIKNLQPATETDSISRDEMIIQIMPLIEGVVNKTLYNSPYSNTEDFVSVATIACLESYDRFDSSKSSLTTYMYTRIQGAVLDEMRRLSIKSRYSQDQAKKIEAARKAAGPSASDADVAKSLGCDLSTMRRWERLQTSGIACSIDDVNPSELTTGERSAEAKMVIDSITKSVLEVMNGLNDEDTAVMECLYLYDMSQTEISHLMGLSSRTISRIHTGVVKRVCSALIEQARSEHAETETLEEVTQIQQAQDGEESSQYVAAAVEVEAKSVQSSDAKKAEDKLNSDAPQKKASKKKSFVIKGKISYQEAKKKVQDAGIKSLKEYRAKREELGLPYHPDRYFKSEWKGMGEFWGTATKNKKSTNSDDRIRGAAKELKKKITRVLSDSVDTTYTQHAALFG